MSVHGSLWIATMTGLQQAWNNWTQACSTGLKVSTSWLVLLYTVNPLRLKCLSLVMGMQSFSHQTFLTKCTLVSATESQQYWAPSRSLAPRSLRLDHFWKLTTWGCDIKCAVYQLGWARHSKAAQVFPSVVTSRLLRAHTVPAYLTAKGLINYSTLTRSTDLTEGLSNWCYPLMQHKSGYLQTQTTHRYWHQNCGPTLLATK